MRALLVVLALLLACDSIQIYRVDGRVVSVDADGQRLKIAHEDIGDFMPAMVMHFDVAAPGLLAGAAALALRPHGVAETPAVTQWFLLGKNGRLGTSAFLYWGYKKFILEQLIRSTPI